MTDKSMVQKQLDFMAGCKYDRYNREPMHGAKVLKADTERLLNEVDWAEGDVDTDAMQIELQAHFDNYFGLSHMEELVRILITEPIQEWVNKKTGYGLGTVLADAERAWREDCQRS